MVEDKKGGDWDRIVPDSEDGEMPKVPKIEEDWPAQLWDHVRHVREGSKTYLSVPFLEFEARSLQMDQHLETKSLYANKGSIPSVVSVDKDLVK